jgi:hypothetical protein
MFPSIFVAPMNIILNIIQILYCLTRGPGSVVGIATEYRLDGPGVESCFETRRRKVAATSCRTVSVASVVCIEVEWCSVVVLTNIGEVNLGESLGTVSDA